MSRILASGLLIDENVSLAPFTSWLVGGNAEFFVTPRTEAELREAIQWGRSQGLKLTILGGGTNVLISDLGIKGLTICLRKLSGVSRCEAVKSPAPRLHIDCLSGTSKSELLKTFLKWRLAPALFLAGLPGDVGGGVVMNAGVGEMMRPREFVEIVDWIEVLRWDEQDPTSEIQLVRMVASDLKWSYRHCEGWRPGVVVRVGISWPLEPIEDILNQVKQANHVRLTKQPLDMPSCGSVFINPEGHKSGQLIEKAGLKGFAMGGAKVSEKHANFIVNFNNATASDVNGVIQHVRQTVKAQTGVDLRTEVVYLGEW